MVTNLTPTTFLLPLTAMFEHTHPAYQHWIEWGKEVRALHEQGVIRGIVFVSAHWQAEDLRQGVYGTLATPCTP